MFGQKIHHALNGAGRLMFVKPELEVHAHYGKVIAGSRQSQVERTAFSGGLPANIVYHKILAGSLSYAAQYVECCRIEGQFLNCLVTEAPANGKATRPMVRSIVGRSLNAASANVVELMPAVRLTEL